LRFSFFFALSLPKVGCPTTCPIKRIRPRVNPSKDQKSVVPSVVPSDPCRRRKVRGYRKSPSTWTNASPVFTLTLSPGYWTSTYLKQVCKTWS
jgi:hypothetical protein